MKRGRLLISEVLLLGLISCGGGTTTSSVIDHANVVVAIAITPTSMTVSQGATYQFVTIVSGSNNTAVSWSVQETTGGTVNTSGVYLAPAIAGTYHVIATSQADPSKTATSTVTVPALSLTVSPGTASVNGGSTITFTSAVTGTADTGVKWSVLEGAAGGVITRAGVYTAPLTGGTYHVVATSSWDSSVSAQASISVISVVAVSINPCCSFIGAFGETISFTAAVAGSENTTVTWSIQEGAVGGSITAAGQYTAPQTSGTYHLVATSNADPSKSSVVWVNVAPLTISITPESSVKGPGGLVPLRASVWANNRAVTWSVQEGPLGSFVLRYQGYEADYIAPSPFAGAATLHLVATSVLDPSKSATVTVTLVSTGFRPTGSMSQFRRDAAATLLADGRVLVSGGEDVAPNNSLELYDPSSGTFTYVPAYRPRSGHTATLLADGRVLLAGGWGGTYGGPRGLDPVYLSSAELFDPAKGTFTPTGDMLGYGYKGWATRLLTGKVLMNNGEQYDPSTGTFDAIPGMGTTSTAGVLLKDGRVLLTAWRGPFGSAEVGIYDPATSTVTPTGSMNMGRRMNSATLLADGRVLLAGGCGNDSQFCSSSTTTNTAEIFDVATGQFTFTSNMNFSYWTHVAALLPNGKVLVAGETAEVFDPASNTWEIVGSPAFSRKEGSAIRLLSGEILVISDITTLAELYQ